MGISTKQQTTTIAHALYELRRDRLMHPRGTFDKGGRWYPSADEECDCCHHIRTPSRSWPYSMLMHCRTFKHCKQLVAKQEAVVHA